VLDAYSAAQAKATSAASAPLQQYTGNTVAGFTPDQTAAMQTIDNSQGIAQPYINQAAGYAANAATPITPTAFSPAAVSQYESPYTSQVVNATEAQMQNMDAQQQQGVVGNAISKGAWGGDRAGIAQAELSNQQDLANNQTIAGLENSGYTQALGEFNQQQTTGVNAQTASDWLNANAASTYGALGNEAQNTALTGASAQMQSGTAQQTLAQENLNVPYQQFLQQQAYPFQTSQFQTQAATGLSNQGGGSTSTSPGADTTGQTIGTLASIAALAAMAYERGGAVKPRGFDTGGNVFGAGFKLPAVPGASVNIVPGPMNLPGGGGSNGGIPAPPQAPVAGSGAGGGSNPSAALVGLGKEIKDAKVQSAAQQAKIDANSNDGFGSKSVPDQSLYGKPPVPDVMTTGNTNFSDPSMFGDMYGGADIGAAGAGADAGAAADASVASDAMMVAAARGGVIRRHGFDAGGDVQDAGLIAAGVPDAMGGSPIANSQLQRYQGMSPEQLQEMSQRIPSSSPQSQIVNRALMAARMKPSSTAVQPVAKGAPSVAGMAPVAPTVASAAGVQPQQGQPQQPQQQGQQMGSYGPYRRGGPVGFADGGMPGLPSYMNPTSMPGAGVSIPGAAASALRRGGIARGFDDGGPVDDADLDGIGDLYAGGYSPPRYVPVQKGEQPALETGAWLRGTAGDVGTSIGDAASALLNKDNSSVHYGLGDNFGADAVPSQAAKGKPPAPPEGAPADLSGIGDVYADPRGAIPAGIDLSGIGDLYGGSAAVPARGLSAPPPDDVVMPAGRKPSAPRLASAMPAGISAPPAGLAPPPSGLDDDLDDTVPSQALEGKPPIPDDTAPQPDLSGKPASALSPAGGKPAAAAASSDAAAPDKGGTAWNDQSIWMPILAAGLGAMSSHNTTALGVLGEGGLRGLEYMSASQKAALEAKKAASDDTYRQGELANSSQKNQQDAKRLDQEADRYRGTLGETTRHNQADEILKGQQQQQTATYQQGMLDRGKFTVVAGTGTDENGNTVPGAYEVDSVNKTSTFRPGMVLTGKPGGGQGQRAALADILMKPGQHGETPAAATLTQALAMLDDPTGKHAAQIQNARDSLAAREAMADVGYVSDPLGTLDKYRAHNGLPPAPGAQPSAAAPQQRPAAAPAQRQAPGPTFPAMPAGVPAGAQFSPSKNSWWWQQNGKWQSAPGG
jgi:hypothetical protein